MDTLTEHHVFRKCFSKCRKDNDGFSVIHERGRGIAWRIWPGAHVLLDWLEENEEKWCKPPCHVIEIGAGVGLVGIACAALGAQKISLTDLPEELDALHRSRDSNTSSIKERITVRPLRFGDMADVDDTASQSLVPENLVVVGSELIYWESLFEPIAQTLQRFVYLHNAVVYIGYRIRVWKTEKRFFSKVLQKHGLDCEVVGQWLATEEDTSSQLSDGHILYEEHEGGEWNTRVYKIFKKKSTSHPSAPTVEAVCPMDKENLKPLPKSEKRKPKKIAKQERKGRAR
jgi:hypothetical protein